MASTETKSAEVDVAPGGTAPHRFSAVLGLLEAFAMGEVPLRQCRERARLELLQLLDLLEEVEELGVEDVEPSQRRPL